MGITPIGQKIISDLHGVYHVVDWVGSTHYPNVQDYIEEVKAAGISRRVSKSLDLSKLTKESRLLLLHSRAIILTAGDYWRVVAEREGVQHVCCLSADRGGEDHRAAQTMMCAGLWAHDVEGGEDSRELGSRALPVTRTIGDTVYYARRRVALDAPPAYRPGYFAAFPIGHFVLVNDPDRPAEVDATYAKISERLTAFELHREDQ